MKEAHVESSSGCIMGFVRLIQPVTYWMRMPQAGIALRFAMGFIATAIYLMPLF